MFVAGSTSDSGPNLDGSRIFRRPGGEYLNVVDLLKCDEFGLRCAPGGFHVDPWKPVPLAVVTHAHSDHARPGSGRYLCAASGVEMLRRRVHPGAVIEGVPFGERVKLGSVEVSFHPAGHVLGSAQVRVSDGETVWVVSGDYKREPDPVTEAFEPVACDVFITEATFAMPVYTWRPGVEIAGEIAAWWAENRAARRASVLFTYALGKAQRALAEVAQVEPRTGSVEWPVYVHGAVAPMMDAYRDCGVNLPRTWLLDEGVRKKRVPGAFSNALIIAPPSAAGTPWMRRFGAGDQVSTGFASGWMQVRGVRRRRGYDRGFVLSDHADWPGLLRTIAETGAKRVLATHGYSETLSRFLRERGLAAEVLRTEYGAEEAES